MKKLLYLIALVILIVGGTYWYKHSTNKREIVQNIQHEIKQINPTNKPPVEDKALPEQVLLQVPFTSQAPYAEWADEEYESACEEAGMLMAYYWTQGKTEEVILQAEAKDQLAKEIQFEKDNYGFSYDSSSEDTVKWASAYFKYDKFVQRKDISYKDILQELANGNLVVAHMDGTKLHNPNFRNGGPEEHVLVIKGYDQKTGEFITNDPGTRKGENYRYDYAVIEDALRDYPTGHHEPIPAIHKNIIVVSK